MNGILVVCGHGRGISDAVARRFGKEGFSVAIVARSAQRLSEAAATLAQAGIEPGAVAEEFWKLYERRTPTFVDVFG